MPSQIVVFLKKVGRLWFWFLFLVILIVFIYNREAALWITGITLALYILSYVPYELKRTRLVRFMKDYYMIEEDTIAENLKKPLRVIQGRLFDIYQKQDVEGFWHIFRKRHNYLIVFANKRYVFYHKDTILKFIELYRQGADESEILEKLKEKDLRTRAEVKIIKETLLKNHKMPERAVSVKEHREEQKKIN